MLSRIPKSTEISKLTAQAARAAMLAAAFSLMAGCGILKTRSQIESEDSASATTTASASDSTQTRAINESNLQTQTSSPSSEASNITTNASSDASLSTGAHVPDASATAGSTLDRDLLALGATPPPVAPAPLADSPADGVKANGNLPTPPPVQGAPRNSEPVALVPPPPSREGQPGAEPEAAPLPPEKRPFAATPPTSPYVKKGDRKRNERPVTPPPAAALGAAPAGSPATGAAMVAPTAASSSASGLDRFMNKPYTVNYGSAQSTLLIENANTILLTTQNGPQSRTVERIPATISGLRPGVFMISGRKEDRTAFTMVSDFEQGLVKSQFVYPDHRTEKLEGSLTQQ